MTTTTVADLHGQATVDMTVDEAFRFFTESIGRWWPAEYHIGNSAMVDTILEPQPGGRWYERGADGSECDWGRVLAWEPPHRIVLTWQINGSWHYDPDPARASEIEVRFTPDGPQQTLVELQHRHLDRLIDGQTMHDAIDQAGGGWSSVLQMFAAAAPQRQQQS